MKFGKFVLCRIASVTVLALGIAIIPSAVWAESTNIVAETENQTTLTMSQVKQLAVLYNPTKKTYELNQDRLDLNERITEKNLRKTRSAINSLGEADTSTINSLKAQIEAETDPTKLAELEAKLKQAEATWASENAALDSQFESAVDTIDQLNDTLDDYEEEQDDLNKTIADWEVQVGMIAEILCMQATQYEQNIAILEKQIMLSEKALQLAEVQTTLGMALTTDVTANQISLAEAKQTLTTAKENYNSILRQINVLIGREQDSALTITGTEVSVILNDIPVYSDVLVQEIAGQNYTLKTYERTIKNYKDDAKDADNSTTRESIENNIQSVRLQMEEYERTVDNNVKSQLAKMNADKTSYEISQKTVTVERKNYELAQKKYDLGMLTSSELLQAEISYETAFNTYWKNKWDYHLDWQEYYAMQDGVDLSAYSKYRM